MLSKLSIRNIRRNLRNYAVYFFTLVLGTAIFYVFNALSSQTLMLQVSERTHQLVELMGGAMGILSVFVACVLGGLIIYASRFLMKRRKREFGIYMTLGMSKGQISRILLVETIVIGLMSLIVGLMLGVLLSQLMSVLVANVFEADMTQYRFVFSPGAVGATLMMFAVIYVVVLAFNSVSVRRQKLINLMQAHRVPEKVRAWKPWVYVVMFLMAVGLLVRAYIGALSGVEELEPWMLVVYIIFGIAGTVLLFWSWSGLALRILKRFPRLYFRGMNTFVAREVNSKINTTVVSMSVICVLLFLTIGGFSSAMSINQAMTKDLQELVPADFIGRKFFREGDTDTVAVQLGKLGVEVEESFSTYVEAEVLRTRDITFADTLGNDVELNGKLDGLVSMIDMEDFLAMEEDVMRMSKYNALARIYGLETVDLKENEYVVAANNTKAAEVRNAAMAGGEKAITVGERMLYPKYGEVIEGFWDMNGSRTNIGLVVVPDDVLQHELGEVSVLVGNFNSTDEAGKLAIEKEVEEKANRWSELGMSYLAVSTRARIYENSVGLSAMATFVGLYLGSVFLVTGAALLALKEVSESSDNQEKYLVLSKLGVDRGSLSRALLAQIGIFFGLPLVVACVHAVFGIAFANTVILTFADIDLLMPIVLTALLIVGIYGGYFLITYSMSRKIVFSRD